MNEEEQQTSKKADDASHKIFGYDDRDTKQFYIDPQHLRDLIREYKNEKKKNPETIMSDELARVLLTLTIRFTSKPSFSGYSWREDMCQFAVSKLILAVDKIDPDDPRSPFGYLTQTCFRSIIQYIKKEKQYEKTKDSVRDKVYNDLAAEYGLKEVHNPNYEEDKEGGDRVILVEEGSEDQ